MRTSTVATLSFLAGWATAASTTVWFIVREEQPAPVAKPIAHLVEQDGALDYRGRDDLLWRGAGLHQPFGKDTRVATGRGSKATIALEDGRTLVIDADSLVVLTKEDSVFSQDQSAFIVTLAKGTVVVKEDPEAKAEAAKRSKSRAPPPKLVLKTNDQVVTVKESASEVTLAKPELEAPAEVRAAAGAVETRPAPPPPPEVPPPAIVALPPIALPEPTRPDTSLATAATATDVPRPEEAPRETASATAITATATAREVATEPKPELAAQPEPMPLVAPAAELPIAPEPEPQRLVLESKLPPASPKPREIEVKKPTRALPPRPLALRMPLVVASYEPKLEVAGQPVSPQMVLWSRQALDADVARLTVRLTPPRDKSQPSWSWAPLLRARSDRETKVVARGRPEWQTQQLALDLSPLMPGKDGMTIELTPGASGRRDDGDTHQSFGGSGAKLTLRSLAELPTTPLTLTLSLDESADAAARSAWLVESPSLGRSEANVWRIGIRRGVDAAKLLPLIEAARAFRIEPGMPKRVAIDSLSLVRDQRVVAVVTSATQPSLRTAERLGHLLGAEFVYRGPAAALIDRGADLKTVKAERPRVFAVNLGFGESFYGIRQVFLSDYPNVERFMRDNSLALFDRPVELMWRKLALDLTAQRGP